MGIPASDGMFGTAYVLASISLLITGAAVAVLGMKADDEVAGKMITAGIIMFVAGTVLLVTGLSILNSIFVVTGVS